MRYGKEERVTLPVPELSETDTISQAEAARLLNCHQQQIVIALNDGKLTPVWQRLAPDRWRRALLRAEIEALDSVRSPGGARYREPLLVSEDPVVVLDGCDFGLERRVLRPAPEIGPEDLVSQREATEILGMHRSTLVRRINGGRFTAVWDLESSAGGGKGSRRYLLRAEVEEVARRGEQRRPVNLSKPPGCVLSG